MPPPYLAPPPRCSVREEQRGSPIFEGKMPKDKPSHILKFFGYKHLPAHLQAVSQAFYSLADEMDSTLPDSAEKSAGLRKLLEAKDCMVRAAMEK